MNKKYHLTGKQEIASIVLAAMKARQELFPNEEAQMSYDKAYHMTYSVHQAETTELLDTIITCPRLMSDDDFETSITTELDEPNYDEESEL